MVPAVAAQPSIEWPEDQIIKMVTIFSDVTDPVEHAFFAHKSWAEIPVTMLYQLKRDYPVLEYEIDAWNHAGFKVSGSGGLHWEAHHFESLGEYLQTPLADFYEQTFDKPYDDLQTRYNLS